MNEHEKESFVCSKRKTTGLTCECAASMQPSKDMLCHHRAFSMRTAFHYARDRAMRLRAGQNIADEPRNLF
jgi:hypothetical protein